MRVRPMTSNPRHPCRSAVNPPHRAQVWRELRGQNTTAARLGTIESRLSSLEGSILSAGGSWASITVTDVHGRRGS